MIPDKNPTMLFKYIFTKFNGNQVIRRLLLISLALFISCGSDDKNDPGPGPNYEGDGSFIFRYQKARGTKNPYTFEAAIYDQDDTKIYSKTWTNSEFENLQEESEDNLITLENIPAGPHRSLILLGKDFFSNIVIRGEVETFSVEAARTPAAVEIIGWGFTSSLLSPLKNSVSTSETLPSFLWEPVPGAEKYKILIKNLLGTLAVDTELDENTFTYTEAKENSGFAPAGIGLPDGKAPFPDTGQINIFSDMDKLNIFASGADYFGQDAHYTKNSQSYTAVDYDGEDSFAITNTMQLPSHLISANKFTWQVSAIDSYGNIGPPTKANSFSIIWPLVKDNITGLTWEVKTKNDYSIHGKDKLYTWQGAQNFINDLNNRKFGGYNDWRLPEIQELSSIFNCRYGEKDSNTENSAHFPNTEPAPYVTSTSLSHYNTPYNEAPSAWHIDFSNGVIYERNWSLAPVRVRAVRGEKFISYFIDNDDGTVTDSSSGLMWQKEVKGPMTWKQALEYCEGLNLIDNDWRLPNRNELLSLVDYSRNAPIDIAAINPVFAESEALDSDSLPLYYWTSTTSTDNIENAFMVSFRDGKVSSNNKIHSDNIMVRAVRYSR